MAWDGFSMNAASAGKRSGKNAISRNEMLGLMTESKAAELGFTHHGSYYGIPIYVGNPEQECMVTTKAWWLEPLFYVATCMEGWCHVIRNTQPSFMLKIHREIRSK